MWPSTTRAQAVGGGRPHRGRRKRVNGQRRSSSRRSSTRSNASASQASSVITHTSLPSPVARRLASHKGKRQRQHLQPSTPPTTPPALPSPPRQAAASHGRVPPAAPALPPPRHYDVDHVERLILELNATVPSTTSSPFGVHAMAATAVPRTAAPSVVPAPVVDAPAVTPSPLPADDESDRTSGLLRAFLSRRYSIGHREAAVSDAATLARHLVPQAKTAHVLAAARSLAALQVIVQHQDWLALAAIVQGTRLSGITYGSCVAIVNRAGLVALQLARGNVDDVAAPAIHDVVDMVLHHTPSVSPSSPPHPQPSPTQLPSVEDDRALEPDVDTASAATPQAASQGDASQNAADALTTNDAAVTTTDGAAVTATDDDAAVTATDNTAAATTDDDAAAPTPNDAPAAPSTEGDAAAPTTDNTAPTTDNAGTVKGVSPSMTSITGSDTSGSPTGGTYFLPRPSRVATSRVVVHPAAHRASLQERHSGVSSPPVLLSHKECAVVHDAPPVEAKRRRRRHRRRNQPSQPPTITPNAQPPAALPRPQPLPAPSAAAAPATNRVDAAARKAQLRQRRQLVQPAVAGPALLSPTHAAWLQPAPVASTPSAAASTPRAPLAVAFPSPPTASRTPSPRSPRPYTSSASDAPSTATRSRVDTLVDADEGEAGGESDSEGDDGSASQSSSMPPASLPSYGSGVWPSASSTTSTARHSGRRRPSSSSSAHSVVPPEPHYHGDALLRRALRRQKNQLLEQAVVKEMSGSAGYVSHHARRKVEATKRAIINDRLLRLDAFYLSWVDKAKARRATAKARKQAFGDRLQSRARVPHR